MPLSLYQFNLEDNEMADVIRVFQGPYVHAHRDADVRTNLIGERFHQLLRQIAAGWRRGIVVSKRIDSQNPQKDMKMIDLYRQL